MPIYKYEVTCTCDEHCDDPCPAHKRENSLQNLNLKLMLEIEEWKKATGLMDSCGDPDGVKPSDLYNEINHLRQQQEKQWGIADEAIRGRYEDELKTERKDCVQFLRNRANQLDNDILKKVATEIENGQHRDTTR